VVTAGGVGWSIPPSTTAAGIAAATSVPFWQSADPRGPVVPEERGVLAPEMTWRDVMANRRTGYGRNWKRWLAIYAAVGVVIYLIVYFLFFYSGGGGAGTGGGGLY
jgi:hypothetical protein